jgi:hypothetical protein
MENRRFVSRDDGNRYALTRERGKPELHTCGVRWRRGFRNQPASI